jgi:hypothetical protein
MDVKHELGISFEDVSHAGQNNNCLGRCYKGPVNSHKKHQLRKASKKGCTDNQGLQASTSMQHRPGANRLSGM